MSNEEATQILQHAAAYIFCTRIIRGSGKTMRGTIESWQSMSTLHGCVNEIRAERAARRDRAEQQAGEQLALAASAFWSKPLKPMQRAALVQMPMMVRSA